ncbi:MAG TPA: nuclear transport factor 2 family protein [Candidatus Binatia bacterium]|jgi:ketosteroid isomerase-like protein|nr:nuclear transport factor 2 family protein [Candidatus Binatia bacterium]
MTHHDDEAAVRAVVDGIAAAVRAADIDALLEHCVPDLTTFDMVPPLWHAGAKAIGAQWAQALAVFVPPLDYECAGSR